MRRRGFTFVELQTVLAIIATLAAILFPVFAKARERARQCSCCQNLVSIALAIRFYAADHGGPPPANDNLSPLYPRYLPTEQVFICPSSGASGVPMGAPANPDAGAEEVSPSTALQGPEPLATCYYYRARHRPEEMPPAIILSDQGPIHNGRANVVYTDGRAQPLLAAAWRARGFRPIEEIWSAPAGSMGMPGGMGMPGMMPGGPPPGGPPAKAGAPAPPPGGGG